MGKLLLLILLVTVFKCNGHLPGLGDFVPAAQRQVQGALGFASSIIGGIASGIGLNFNGQLGYNTQKRPEYNNQNQYANRPHINPGEMYATGENRPNYAPPNQHHYDHHSHRPYPPHHDTSYGSGYGNQGQHQKNPSQYGNEYYNNNNPYHSESGPVRPGHHNEHHGGNFYNNGHYGNQYPHNQNLGNNQGYNHEGFNNNEKPNSESQGNDVSQGHNNNQFYQNGQGHPAHQNFEGYNKPGHGNNNQNNENNQEHLINHIFGNNPQYPNAGFNSTTQNPNKEGINLGNENLSSNKPNNIPLELPTTQGPKEDLPTFVPLTPVDNKRETGTKKPAAEDEEFDIDIRFKDQ